MENKFFEYGKIRHFTDVSKKIYGKLNKDGVSKSLDFKGTVKLHGTNFSIVYDVVNNNIYYQKRTSLLKITDNFFGFQHVVIPIEIELKEFLLNLHKDKFPESKYIICFGELIGQEIQRGVAIENLKKTFVIFDIVDENYNALTFEDHKNLNLNITNIYNINNFKTWNISLNIMDSADMLEKRNIISQITLDVEKECPFAAHFGFKGVGEGVVWTNDEYQIKFKVKGEEHSNSKVRTLTGISQDKIDSIKGIYDLCENICTENRYKQGLKFLEENNIEEKDRKNKFLQWVVEDTLTEEIDIIIEKRFNLNTVKSQLYKNAVFYYQSLK